MGMTNMSMRFIIMRSFTMRVSYSLSSPLINSVSRSLGRLLSYKSILLLLHPFLSIIVHVPLKLGYNPSLDRRPLLTIPIFPLSHTLAPEK